MAKTGKKKVSCTIPIDSAFTHILFNLAAQGYSYIKVSYSGSGDSGAIDEVTLIKRGGVVEADDECFSLAPLAKEDKPDSNLQNLIENKVYVLLEKESDWYNSEGGGGTLFISTEDNKYKGDHYQVHHEENHEIIEGTLGD